MRSKRERSQYAAILGRRGGKERAKKLTPEERTESARKAARVRWNGGKALKMVRDVIERIESGSFDLERARLCRRASQLQLKCAALGLRADRLGVDDAFFNTKVDQESVKEYRAVTKQLGDAIRRRWGVSR